jgi:hypothetical protein
LQGRQIDRPFVSRLKRQRIHVDAAAARDLIQRLIGGPGNDGVLAWPQQHVHQDEDRFFRSGKDERLVRRDALVQRRDFPTQQRVAGRLGVAEPQVPPEGEHFVVGECQELRHGQRLDIRSAGDVPDDELPAGEESLEGEGRIRHGKRETGNGKRRQAAEKVRRFAGGRAPAGVAKNYSSGSFEGFLWRGIAGCVSVPPFTW